MPRFYFHIQNGRPFDDIDGLELSDLAAARAEAMGFARDIMRLDHRRRDWSNWAIRVTNEQRDVVLELPFADAI